MKSAFSLSVSIVLLIGAVIAISVVISTAMLGGGNLHAEGKKKAKGVPSVILDHDKNGDNRLDLAEFTDVLVSKVMLKSDARIAENAKLRFQKKDADGDGMTDDKRKLKLDEFTALSRERARERTQEKVADRATQRFTEIDANGDSFLDAEEFKASRKKAKQGG